MFESLFGAETPLAVRFFLAFIVVLLLIGATAWVIRRFGGDRLSAPGARGRQPRLAVIDAANVDGRRRLVLIRRDNVEHLVLIGGGSDVVVETNIVRGNAVAPREAAPARAASADALPRAVPLDDATSWPLAPEPGAPRARPTLAEETAQWPLEAEPAPRATSRPEPTTRGEPAPKSAPAVTAEPGDKNLADMASRLEAALRRPSDSGARKAPAADALNLDEPERPAERAPRAARSEPRVEPRMEPRPESRAEARAESRAEVRVEPRLDAKPEPKAPAAKPYVSLEQEMASLLGRPTGKGP